jgi:hypothetical protein
MDDLQAIERYRYMLRTAPPDDIERAHAEAFAQLTPEQRQVVLRELSARVPASERPASDDPQQLARAATRAEMRQPGTMERTFGQVSGPGLGGMFLSTLAGAFVGTAIADAFFADSGYDGGGGGESADAGAETEAGADQGAEGDYAEYGADAGGDAGADPGFDAGGDFGGGDFGGGDFGGEF